ncbi:cyclic nucleotide-binding domain-containing protein [Pelomonas sp. SE-A7]|uniref:Crp/Fnr family transcriptional regulator n=1 Tax=Pelomonas sp. SE-A7 TaxID=3054953 RepID=UPI00259CE834|nr:cyclic nucleotide-binding domain-containing protein [Pelomonas sp. SE-A7]MDM4767752.1 cyclic nucleotide-binding domain-containing protein [Pelomonas sp. SE-A7]
MSTTLQIAYVFGFIGAALMVTSYLMKSMLPLRVVALVACLCLVFYGYLSAAIPTLILYAALIPINIKKTLQIQRLVRAIRNAKEDTPVSEWLLPHMSRRAAKAGTLLWSKGDQAEEMLYLESGSLRLLEIDELLEAGALVGEIGLFTVDHQRTLSLQCETDCVLYSLSADAMARLYYQNPKLGFHVMRLVVARLMRDVQRSRSGNADTAGP